MQGRTGDWVIDDILVYLYEKTDRFMPSDARASSTRINCDEIADLSRSTRNKKDNKEQQHSEHGAGKALRNTFGDVGHKDDESRADDRSGQPADAADHHAEEQRDRQRDGVTVGRDELHGD